MKITRSLAEHVANLARLDFTEQEKVKLIKDMETIISYLDKLKELDTSDITPREHVKPIRNVFREDSIKESFDRKRMLANAPCHEKGCYKVPKIVE